MPRVGERGEVVGKGEAPQPPINRTRLQSAINAHHYQGFSNYPDRNRTS